MRRSHSAGMVALLAIAALLPASLAQGQASVIREITQPNDRLEMTVNTSRILTLETRIPRLVVTNPELVTATPISENQVQIAARKPGVTQINLWDENGKVYTVDLLIFGDVRELDMTLKRMFPESSLKVVKLSQSLVLEGQVDRPEIVSTIRTLAEDYAPKVVNNISVGGVQQVLLKVKVMEVSRTKLRRLGFDFAQISGSNVFASSAAGILSAVSSAGATGSVPGQGQTVEFSVVDGGDSFFGFLDALQQNNMAKILADPTLVAVSGRPAHFNVGGEFPVIIPQGLGQTAVEYKAFGTQVDFVPIVLGNGRIRLEVRPRVSEIDDSRSVTLNTFEVPALRVREVDTGVEMNAGQTLALAGLIQTRIDASHRGLPFISDLPYIGAPFRRVVEEVNEIELLIMVTPEFADGLDPHEVPQCGPGMETVSPSHCELYGKGYIEVPSCGPCGSMVGACGADCSTSSCATGGCTTGNCNGCYSDNCTVNLQTPLGHETAGGYAETGPIGMPTPGATEYGPSYGYVQEGDQPATPADQPAMTFEQAPIEPTAGTAPIETEQVPPAAPKPAELQLNNQPRGAGQLGEELPDPSASRYGAPWAMPQAAQQPGYQQPGQLQSPYQNLK
ncbi:MAG: pilus assembly protein N-terminal domain-containing protein, partial [Lacipirellulaceae bacterium]